MAKDNIAVGHALYHKGDQESRDWFERQWRIWPKRADENLTTNLALHYGGVTAYREVHGKEPELSTQFAANIRWIDAMTKRPRP